MSPRALAAPLHRHLREDEYSYVVEGRMGAVLGDDVLEAAPGDLVFKPRGEWHTFWNAGDEPCRIVSRGKLLATCRPRQDVGGGGVEAVQRLRDVVGRLPIACARRP